MLNLSLIKRKSDWDMAFVIDYFLKMSKKQKNLMGYSQKKKWQSLLSIKKGQKLRSTFSTFSSLLSHFIILHVLIFLIQ